MSRMMFLAAAIAFSVAVGYAAAQAPPQPPAGGQGGGQGRGGGRGGPGGAAPAAQAPARGITVNLNPIQRATANISGPGGIKGTAELIEYQAGNTGLIQVVLNLEGVPPGMHGVQIHAVGRCEGSDFASAGGHFDPGPAGNPDVDLNHPFHAGDLANVTAGANGAVSSTTYTTRFNLGGPLSPFDADGASIVIHQNLDTYQTGTKGQGVAGGPGIACGALAK